MSEGWREVGIRARAVSSPRARRVVDPQHPLNGNARHSRAYKGTHVAPHNRTEVIVQRRRASQGRTFAVFAIVALVFIAPRVCMAEPITFQFTGVVDFDSSEQFPGGTIVVGSYTFDSEAENSTNGWLSQGDPYGFKYRMFSATGGIQFQSHDVRITRDPGSFGEYWVHGEIFGNSYARIIVSGRDLFDGPWGLPLSPPDLSKALFARFNLTIDDQFGAPSYTVGGPLTSLTRTEVVPEPATFLLVTPALLALRVSRRRRT